MRLADKVRAILGAGRGILTELPGARLDSDPFELFASWFSTAVRAGIYLPEAMTLASCDSENRPRARIVLLKRFDERGFVFFTNYASQKARELEANAHAALVLHWSVLQRQVRIEGSVTKLSQEESNKYFQTRPRGSRIGAWASRQSARLESRSQLLHRVEQHTGEFEGQEIPLPPFWGGYLLNPVRIEFWQGRKSRLHERVVFTRKNQEPWQAHMLYP